MNTQLINKLFTKAREEINTKYGYSDAFNGIVTEKFAAALIEETIKLLNKSDPGFNAFSERLVRQHFGMR